MRFVTNIEEQKFNAFVERHENGHALQTAEWGKFKSIYEWSMELLGMEDEQGEIVAAAMILRRNIPIIRRSILYAPRGYIMDYDNNELVEKFTKSLKDYAKKTKAIFLKIDPCIKYREHNMEGEIIEGGFNNSWIIESLESLGYIHRGVDSLGFEEVQPRFVFTINIDKDKKELLDSFHHKTRYNIRLAKRKGIEIYEGKKEDLVEFSRIMEITGDRDGFRTRPLSYFQNMYNVLEPSGKMKLFMAKYNVKKAYENTEKDLNKEKKSKKPDQNRITKLEKQKVELTQLVNEHPEGINVSGTILLLTAKRAWYLYGASDNIYRNLMPNYLIQWEMIQYAMEKGCNIYDFRGISGDLNPDNPLYGLYRFKKGFNGDFVEYIGEFDLVVRPFLYHLWEFWLPKIKKILKKMKR
ncbi:MAG: lipid II:glycine glycyltransferase FemX [Eubacteriales bacterium]